MPSEEFNDTFAAFFANNILTMTTEPSFGYSAKSNFMSKSKN